MAGNGNNGITCMPVFDHWVKIVGLHTIFGELKIK